MKETAASLLILNRKHSDPDMMEWRLVLDSEILASVLTPIDTLRVEAVRILFRSYLDIPRPKRLYR